MQPRFCGAIGNHRYCKLLFMHPTRNIKIVVKAVKAVKDGISEDLLQVVFVKTLV